jgi:dCTP deaminase
MIFTDREIKLALAQGTLIIEPRPADVAYSSTSVDLTLDPIISEFVAKNTDRHFDPGRPGTVDRYELKPHTLILAWTTEYVDLRKSPRLAARVEGKSSLGRLGLGVHITAPTIHAGFDGQIQLEIINHGPIPIRLRPGMRICQLIFEQTLGTPEKGYGGQFSGQKSQ